MRAFAKQYGAALALSLFSAGALAGTYTQSPDPASVAAGASVNVDFLFAGDGVTEDTQLELNYNTTVFTTVTPTVLVPGSVCAAFTGPGFIRIVPPSGGGVPLTNTATAYCRFAFGAAGGAAAGNYDFTQRSIECTPGMAACTRSGTFRITVTGGGGGGTAPTVTYTPAAGSTINFPAGAAGTATSSITVTSAGGTAPGTVTVNNCSASAGFTITNGPINLTGTAGGAQINSSIALQCTRGGAVQNGTLSCTETPTPAVGGSPFTRTWNLTCPQATVANTPPTITYTPAAGSNINIPSNSSSTIQVGCPTDGAACNGSGSGLDATARLENITVAYNGPPFSPTPNDLTCTFVTEAGAAAGATLDFVPAQADSGDIRCSCTQVFTAEPYIVTVRERIPASSGTVTATRTFNVTCGAGLTCGSITATPAGGNVGLNNGGAAVQVSSIAVANIPAGVTQTVNCALSAINGATFNVTTTPTPMVLSSTTTTGTVSATCNNASTTTAGTATLTCTSAGSAPGCPALSATYNLSCPPGQAPPPPVELVPVPALGEQGRILLAALMLALGLVVVGFRLRG